MAIAILVARGWECGNSMLNTVDIINGAGSIAANAHTGSYSIRMGSIGSANNAGRWAIPGTPSNPSISLWVDLDGTFNYSGTGTQYSNLRFLLSTGQYVELRWNGVTHTYDAYVNNALVASGTIEVSVNAYFHVQFYAVIADAGSIQVKIDGHLSIDYSGDTQPGAAAGATYFYLYGGAGGSYDYYDDLVIGSGGYLGDLRSYEKRPNTDDSVTWTPSTGAANYALEDETPESDADYNEADTDAIVDEFGLTALDLTGLTAVAVVPWSRVKMTDGVGDSLYVGIASGVTDSDKLSALSTAWEYYWGNVDMVDPHDSAAWNQAKVDAVLHRKVAVIP